VLAGRDRERTDVANASAEPAEREQGTYGPVGRALGVREQEREQGWLYLGRTQHSLRILTPAQAHFLHLVLRCWAARAIAPAGMRFTASFSRTCGGHRDLAAHRMSERPHARECMRREESEDVVGMPW
jgi:hypothetical protein